MNRQALLYFSGTEAEAPWPEQVQETVAAAEAAGFDVQMFPADVVDPITDVPLLREELSQLLALVRAGAGHCIFVHRLDRLARTPSDLRRIFAAIQGKRGCHLWTAGGYSSQIGGIFSIEEALARGL